MPDSIVSYFLSHWPYFTIALAVIIALIVITWRIANAYHHWKGRVENTEKDCGKIDGHIFPKLDSIDSSINSLNGSFNNLVVYLKGKDGSMDISLFRSRSPIALTELGERVLNAIGGKEFVDNNIELLIKEMDAHGIKTALDSQTFAPIIINKISNQDNFNKIKDYAFKNPYYKENENTEREIRIPLDMGTITNVMGIYLRDKYLERHPELNPDDIPSTP